MEYAEKLKNPRWQKLRLKILERDGWACQGCFDTESMLSVHHLYYEKNKEPWDYPTEALLTLCSECHDKEKNYRKRVEQKLLFALKKQGFLSESVVEIALGFNKMRSKHPQDVTASIMKWAFESFDMWEKIGDLYFKQLKKDGA